MHTQYINSAGNISLIFLLKFTSEQSCYQCMKKSHLVNISQIAVSITHQQ